MKCPNDKTEMEKGFMNNQVWKKGVPLGTKIPEVMSFGGSYVFYYRCPKCGRVELTTETK